MHETHLSNKEPRSLMFFFSCRLWVIFSRTFFTFRDPPTRSLNMPLASSRWKRINRGWLWCRANSYVISILSFSRRRRRRCAASRFWRELVYFAQKSFQIRSSLSLSLFLEGFFHPSRRLRSINFSCVLDAQFAPAARLSASLLRTRSGWLDWLVTTYYWLAYVRDSLREYDDGSFFLELGNIDFWR